MIKGDVRYTRNNRGAIVVDIPAGQVASTIFAFSGTAPLVWGRYNQSGAIGHIQITKILKMPTGRLNVYIADYTPAEGKKWAKNDPPYYGGADPFAPFSGGDNLWRNLSINAFLAVVGHAMASNRAHTSYVAYPNVRQDIQVTTSGGWFRKTTTTTARYYVSPHWYVGTSVENGASASVLKARYKVQGCNPANDPRDQCVADAGVNFINFDGGNMPNSEYLAYQHSESQSGLTFLAQIVFTAITAYISGGLLSDAGWGWAANAGSGGADMLGMTGLGSGEWAAVQGGLYAGGTTALRGGGSLTGAQPQFLGNVGDGQLAPSGNGGAWDPTPSVNSGFVATDARNTPGAAGAFFAQERSTTGSYTETNNVLLMKENKPVQNGAINGY
ncbi:MAG: hypothetical protein PHG47_09580 [Sulfuricella sp.]|nr:hypothetical protein [Sulfuricella sp.]